MSSMFQNTFSHKILFFKFMLYFEIRTSGILVYSLFFFTLNESQGIYNIYIVLELIQIIINIKTVHALS